MWIVRLALRRPYTFVVMALLLVLSGACRHRGRRRRTSSPRSTSPVISVVWTYGGLPAQQMEQQITQFSEYSLSGNVSDIKALQSEQLRRRLGHPPLPPPGRRRRRGHGPGHRRPRRPSSGACRRARSRRSSSATPRRACPILQLAFSQRHAERVGDLRPREPARPARCSSVVQGTRFPAPERRQGPADRRRPRPRGARARTASRRADVNLAISAQNLTLPTGARRSASASTASASTAARRRSRAQRHPDPQARRPRASTCGTSPTCTTASRCRRTSRGATASARSSSPS